MCNSQFESAEAGIGLHLSFAQGCLTVTALGRYEHLESMGARPGRLQFSGLASNRLRFIQFSSIEKNASEIALRYCRQRIEFHRLTCLTLGFVKTPQVNDNSCQQIVGSGISRR